MPRKKVKKQNPVWLLAVFLAVAAFLYIFDAKEEIFTPASVPVPEGTMLVHMLDVGQGDALLVQLDGKNMLIDAGKNDTADELVARLRALGAERLDIVIATHPHEDHIGGMAAVIDAFEIGTMLMPPVTHNTKTFENMLDAIERKDLSITQFKPDSVFELGAATVTIVAPNSAEYEDLNNYSIVTRLVYGENSFLFTGDAESLSEQEMIKLGHNIKSDVLKIGHHGSSSSSTADFLSAVDPDITLISCGKNNTYNHPHEKALERIINAGAKVYRTDMYGEVTLSSDGVNITITTREGGR